ncbi:MAG: glycosyltransferase family A protein [Devosia sp.]
MNTAPYTAIIPAYNAAAFIGDTIGSMLAQTVPPAQIIVVDDGSTDNTADTVAALGDVVELVRQPNGGAGSATTRGFAMVATPFIATLDADDVWVQGKIERQFAYLDAHPEIAAVFAQMEQFEGSPPATAGVSKAVDNWGRSTMLIRTSVAQANGAVTDPPGAGDMVDWIARLREAGHQLAMLPEVLAFRRVHADSMTFRGRQSVAAGYLHTAREAMRRRRERAAKGEP